MQNNRNILNQLFICQNICVRDIFFEECYKLFPIFVNQNPLRDTALTQHSQILLNKQWKSHVFFYFFSIIPKHTNLCWIRHSSQNLLILLLVLLNFLNKTISKYLFVWYAFGCQIVTFIELQKKTKIAKNPSVNYHKQKL